MIGARLARPFAALLPGPAQGHADPDGVRPAARSTPALAPSRLPSPGPAGGTVFPAQGEKRGRVAILQGCAQRVLSPGINQAAIRFLTRNGIEVVLVADEGCCGSLTHHMGDDADALARARANIDVWTREADARGLDAVGRITTSGCGTTIKDYGYMLREDPAYAAKAARISALAKDVTEYVAGLEAAWPQSRSDIVVAYHSACSLQHGQKSRSFRKNCFSRADLW